MDPEVSPPEPAVESAPKGVADIAAEIAEQSSAPNEAAIAATAASLENAPVVRSMTASEGPAPSASSDVPTDAQGATFNAELHVTNSDGSPKLYNGRLRRKRGASLRSAVNVPPKASPAAGTAASAKRQLTPDEVRQSRLAEIGRAHV